MLTATKLLFSQLRILYGLAVLSILNCGAIADDLRPPTYRGGPAFDFRRMGFFNRSGHR